MKHGADVVGASDGRVGPKPQGVRSPAPVASHDRDWPMFAKRVLDLVIAIATMALTSPLWLVAAALIKATSPGPVFFRHKRIGQGGREFTCIKFRSMTVGADPTSLANVADPRITKVGNWLRATALDELPQLINVLRGEMSIVGPRPALPEMVPYYTEEESVRLEAKPGLTGWAQVNGRNSLPYHDRLRLDRWYVRNWSIWLDVRILGRTIPVLFNRAVMYQEDPRPWERRPEPEDS